jgi:hypothetical protein
VSGFSRPPAWPAPALLARPGIWLALLGFLLIPFLVPVPDALQRDMVISTLGDRAHVVLLAALTLALYWRGPVAGRLGVVVVLAAAVGGGIEVVQMFVGRSALWHDFQLDLLGITAAAGLVLWRGHGRRGGMVLLVVALLVVVWELRTLPGRKAAAVAMGERFPQLSAFDQERPLVLWHGYGGSRMSLAESGRGPVLRLDARPSSIWPGVILRDFPHDWSAYDTLKVDLRLVRAPADTLPVGLRLDDYAGVRDHDWYTQRLFVTRGWRTLGVPLRDLTTHWSGRPFETDDVFALAVFFLQPADTVALEIGDLRLE